MDTTNCDWAPLPRPKRPNGLNRALALSRTLYVVSFFLPFGEDQYGYNAFFIALGACFICPILSPWWANPLYWTALVAANNRRQDATAFWGSLAGMFALLGSMYVKGPDPAYPVWLVSIAIVPIAAIYYR